MESSDPLFTSTVPAAPKTITTTGKILLGITGGIGLGLTIICVPFVSPALRKFCLPYIPATQAQIENIKSGLRSRCGGKLLDLGSGDGRIVFELAKSGLCSEAHGIELNPWLVLYSRLKSLAWNRDADHNSKTRFYRGDLWQFPIRDYDKIVIFGVEQMMGDLELKFRDECRRNCDVIACRFALPNTKPVATIGQGIDTVWVYKFKPD